jgi:hypothetical protein
MNTRKINTCPYAGCDCEKVTGNICDKCKNYIIICTNCSSTNKLNSLFCRRCKSIINFNEGSDYYCNKANLNKDSAVKMNAHDNFDFSNSLNSKYVDYDHCIRSNWIVGYGFISFILYDDKKNIVYLAIFSMKEKTSKKYKIDNFNLNNEEKNYKFNLYFYHGSIYLQSIKKFIKVDFDLLDFFKKNDGETVNAKIIHNSEQTGRSEEICSVETVSRYFIVCSNSYVENRGKLYFYKINGGGAPEYKYLPDGNLIINAFYDNYDRLYVVCESAKPETSEHSVYIYRFYGDALNSNISDCICKLKGLDKYFKGNPKNFAFYNNHSDRRSIIFYSGTQKCYKQSFSYSEDTVNSLEPEECCDFSGLPTPPYLAVVLGHSSGGYKGLLICSDSKIYFSGDSGIDASLKQKVYEINCSIRGKMSEEVITFFSENNEGLIFAKGGSIYLFYSSEGMIKDIRIEIPKDGKISHLIYSENAIYALSIDERFLCWFEKNDMNV